MVPGATGPRLTFTNFASEHTGLYDCVVSSPAGSALSRPVVLGLLPKTGERTSGAVTTRPEWQNIRHPNGHTYDQFLLTGPAGTFTADEGEIARLSFLDENESIVQVEMSGAGAITVVLDPTTAVGPMAPALYNQAGIQYMQGRASIVLAGADETTHFTIYSVGPLTNPAVTRADVPYFGWAEVAVAGVVSTDGKLGGIHQGNVLYADQRGYTGLFAPTVRTLIGQPAVVHDIDADVTAVPYLHFGAGGTVKVKIAGGDLSQGNGDNLNVGGLASVVLGAGQSSAGEAAPAQPLRTRLFDSAGRDVTAELLTAP